MLLAAPILYFFLAQAPAGLEAARAEVQRAEARLAKVQEAFAAGALIRAEVEAAERAVAEAWDRFDRLAGGTRKLTPEIAAAEVRHAEDRLKTLRERHQKLRALYDEQIVARREVELAAEAVRDAEGFLDLARLRELELQHEWELLKRVKEWQARGGRYDEKVLDSLMAAYERKFGAPLPISANGMTHTHALLNFDHSGRTDVALHPESEEGRWLMVQLSLRDIPHLAYASAVPGKSTGAHIHLGLPSPRLRPVNGR